jgi:hypothetical protein
MKGALGSKCHQQTAFQAKNQHPPAPQARQYNVVMENHTTTAFS